MNRQPVKLLDRVRHKIRLKHYSIRTEKAYPGLEDTSIFMTSATQKKKPGYLHQ
jgi:hypothetical protein